jgi:hypothetical protein
MIFLDTEFTDLVPDPYLLSIGIVLDGGDPREFYAEVIDNVHREAASALAVKEVLSQFGQIAGGPSSYLGVGIRLVAFMRRLVDSCPPDGSVVVAYSSDFDWRLAEQAMRNAGPGNIGRSLGWESMKHRFVPTNIHNQPSFQDGALASQRYMQTQKRLPMGHRHALYDARALRIFHAAARASASSAAPAQAIPDARRTAAAG